MMRPERLPTLLAVALLVATVALTGCKDDEEEAQLDAEKIAAFQKRSDEKKRKATEAKKAADPKKKATAKAAKKDPKKAAPASAKATVKAKDEARDEAADDDAKPAPRRVTAKDAAEAAAPGEEGDDKLTPAERRRRERQKRIEELKARSEERRKERLARLQKGGDDAPAEDEAEAAPEDAPAAPAGPAAAAVPARPAGPVLDIARFLTINEVREVTDNKALAATGPLVGIPAGPTYNSMYFAPPKRTDFGVAVQVWRETTRRDANDRFRRMRRDFPNAEDTSAVTPKGFFSQWNDLMALVFLDFTKRTIIAVTCSQSVCSPEQLFNLATKAKAKI